MATPKLSFHKAQKQYYARFDGKMVYFGKDHAHAAQRFAETLARYEAGEPVTPRANQEALTIVEAAERYLAYAAQYYGESSEADILKHALRRLCAFCGREPLPELGPKRLKTFQTHLVQQGELSRSGVNRTISSVRRFVKWAVSEEIAPPDLSHALETIQPLRKGRTQAPETEPVKPVPMEHVEAAKAYVTSPVAALIDLLVLSGARPGELVELRPYDVDTSTDPWQTRPEAHKTAWQGRDRVILFGPKAQRVLKPFMLRGEHEYMFSPREAEKERYSRAAVHRRPNQTPNPRKTQRCVGECYTPDSLRRAIEYACRKANIPKWSPYRLRHTAATEIRRQYGLEAAQTVLGHSKADVTQVYAERDFEKAARVIAEIG